MAATELTKPSATTPSHLRPLLFKARRGVGSSVITAAEKYALVTDGLFVRSIPLAVE